MMEEDEGWQARLEALMEEGELEEEVKTIIRTVADKQSDATAMLDLCGLQEVGARALAIALHRNATIEELKLENNQLGDTGMAALAPALTHLSSLTRLELQRNSIGDAGVTALAPALEHLAALKTLDLRHNDIGDAGMKALSQTLLRLSSLEELFLHGNHIGTVGAAALAQALPHLTLLTELQLYRNRIGDAGAKSLCSVLPLLTSLQVLGIFRNGLTESGMIEMLKQLEGMDTRAEIRLFEDSLTSSASVARALATVRTEKPDLQVFFSWTGDEDQFDLSVATAYQEQLDLLQLLELGSVPLETAKVFVCGDYGIGKTTMIDSLPGAWLRRFTRTLRQPGDHPDRPYERTPGICVRDMRLRDSTGDGGGGEHCIASLRVYDFGGQLAYHVIHTLMMSDRLAAFVVCVDLSQPEEHVKERARYWLRFICTRLKQGVAAAEATVDDDAMGEVKPRVVVVGTKRDVAFKKGAVNANGQPPWGAAMIASFKHTFGDIIDIHDSLISVNCHLGRGRNFDALRSHLIEHWRWLRNREVLVPKVVSEVSKALSDAAAHQPMWDTDELFRYTCARDSEMALISANEGDMFRLTLRYLHSRGDLLWYSTSPALVDHVFVSPNWLLHDVLGRALAPDGVQQGSVSENGVVTFTDLETAFCGIASADVVVDVLQHTLLCFELPPDDDGQRRFMLPSRVDDVVDLEDAWPRAGMWPLYGGRRLVVESAAFALPPGFFPHVQTLLLRAFGATLRVWKDAFFCERDGVQCLGLLRSDRAVDVWVRAPPGAECSALPCLMEVFCLLQEEAQGIDHAHLVLSTKHLKAHQEHPTGYRMEDLKGKGADQFVTSTASTVPTVPTASPHPVSERVCDLLLKGQTQPAPVMPSWQLRDHEWHHSAWRLDDTFDEQLPWNAPNAFGVYSAPLPGDTELYRWIESEMASGLTLSRVEVSKSTAMLEAFHAQLKRSANRRSISTACNPFNKDFGAAFPGKRQMLVRLKSQFAQTPSGMSHVNVLVAWHGCDEAVADSITASGTANLSSADDPGYFGAGIYLTPQANYAAGYSTRLATGNWRPPNDCGEHVLLLCAVSTGLTYPITRDTDYPSEGPDMDTCDFLGRKLKNGCDSHYIQVSRRMAFQSTTVPGKFDFEEYVVSQEAQVLPIAKVFVKVDEEVLKAQL